jgi:putative phosphoesterase
MKIFFVADIHGNAKRLKMALNACKQEKADHLVILGDILHNDFANADEDAVITLLNDYYTDSGEAISAVSGNCDHIEELSRLWFPVVDDYLELNIDARHFFLTHGHRYGPGQQLPPLASGTILCFGHHHAPFAQRSGDIILFNPGAISQPQQNSNPGYGVYADGCLRAHNLLTGQVVIQMDC